MSYPAQKRANIVVNPTGGDSGGAIGPQKVTFRLPRGKTFDLSTCRVYLVADYVAVSNGPVIPSPAECIVTQLDVLLDGVAVNHIPHYDHLFAAWSRYNTSVRDFGTRIITSAARSAMRLAGIFGRFTPVVLSSWLGLLGSGGHLNTAAHGDLQVELTLADVTTLGGIAITFQTYMTIDILPDADPDARTPCAFSEWQCVLQRVEDTNATTVMQLPNGPGRRIQYVLATMLRDNYLDFPQDAVQNFGFTNGFRHTSLNCDKYLFTWDGRRFSDDHYWYEFLDRLREALQGVNKPELPLLLSMDAGAMNLRLDDLAGAAWLVGDSASGKDLPDGLVEVQFTVKATGPA
jgi:hypothetical protein